MTTLFMVVKIITILYVKTSEKNDGNSFCKNICIFYDKNMYYWINSLSLTNNKNIQKLEIFLLFLSFIFDNFILLYYL